MRHKYIKHEYGICSLCGKTVRLRVPKGGDGTQMNPVRHKVDYKQCDGYYYETIEKINK